MVYWIPEQLDIVFQLVLIILYMTIAFLALTGFMAIIVAVILILPDSRKCGCKDEIKEQKHPERRYMR